MQALELTNGATLNSTLDSIASKTEADAARDPGAWLERTYLSSLCRPPSATERKIALELLGPQPSPEVLADFLWSLVNLPEFQLIR